MIRPNPMRAGWSRLLGMFLWPGLALAQSDAPAEARTPVIVSPQTIASNDSRIKVFLAGSIDMGGSEDWQAKAIRELSGNGVVLLNPRRADWNPAWKPSADEPEFRRQVEWELDALERADVILMYFAPGSQSPITLLELGLHAGSGKVLLACPEGFWRKGNIDIVAERHGIPAYPSLDALIAAVKVRIAQKAREIGRN